MYWPFGFMLIKMNSFESINDIEITYYERPIKLIGGKHNDQMAAQQFGYKLVNSKGEEQ